MRERMGQAMALYSGRLCRKYDPALKKIPDHRQKTWRTQFFVGQIVGTHCCCPLCLTVKSAIGTGLPK